MMDLPSIFPELENIHWGVWAAKGVRCAAWLVLGLTAAWSVRRLVQRLLSTATDTQRGVVFSRTAYYVVLGLTFTSILRELGFDLGVLLGAAGIVTVAVGFASQTSASNFISGLFLMAEKPFKVGNFVQIGATQGTVMAIDTLSVKLRTLDNIFVRIPNESVIKAEVRNYSRFDVRRIDIAVGVAYREDLTRVRAVLLGIAASEPTILEEPAAEVIITGFGDSAVNLEFRFWTQRVLFLESRNLVYTRIKERFDEHGIEIPFPHRTLYAGSGTAPLPVKVIDR